MKKYALILILILSVAAYGAVELTLVIPNEYVVRVVTALRACENSYIRVHFQGSQNAIDPNVPDFTLDVDYRIDTDPNNPAETERAYAKRFIKTFIYNLVRSYETKIANQERQETIDAIPLVDVNVPDEIIE